MRNTVTILALAALLTGCTTSAQARNAQQIGGGMLVLGTATSLVGWRVSHNATQDILDGCDTRDCEAHARQANNGHNAAIVGGIFGAVGFWTAVIGSIQRPMLEIQEGLHRVQAEDEMIEEALTLSPYTQSQRFQ